MKTMSNVDIYTICQELNQLLSGARVDKSFQPTKDTVLMRFHVTGEGRVDVVFQAGVRTHKTQYPLDNPKVPPSFPMLLRKRLRGATVNYIRQHNFDRVIEISMSKETDYTLIIELFSKGNIILLDEDKNIILPLKRKLFSDRDISSKKEYIFPQEHGINPLDFDKSDLVRVCEGSQVDIARTLARNNFGGLYSEEVLLRAGIDKTTPAGELGSDELDKIFDSINDLFGGLVDSNFSPRIVRNNNSKSGRKEDVLPLELDIYSDADSEVFSTYNEAADEFYSKKVQNEIKGVQEAIWQKKVDKYAKRLSIQEETLEGFKETIVKSTLKGDLIYSNYTQIQSIINVVLDARSKDYSWKDIGSTIKKAKKEGMVDLQIIESIDNLGQLTLSIEGETIRVDPLVSIAESAEVYYEKGKKAKRKINGVLKAITNTQKKLEDIKLKKDIAMEHVMVPQKRVKRELKWYEKLRWFVSSEGNLVIAGRDMHTNEMVVKKHLDNNDVYMHCDVHGASSVVIKSNGNEISEKTLQESATFASCFSSSWGKGYTSMDVFWVRPEQVSKSPEHGEFVPKGSFIIRGNKNYLRGIPLKIAIGIVDYDGPKIMAGPVEALKAYTDNYVVLKPGYTKKEATAKKILHKINKDNIINLDDIVRVLPSGKCDIID